MFLFCFSEIWRLLKGESNFINLPELLHAIMFKFDECGFPALSQLFFDKLHLTVDLMCIFDLSL